MSNVGPRWVNGYAGGRTAGTLLWAGQHTANEGFPMQPHCFNAQEEIVRCTGDGLGEHRISRENVPSIGSRVLLSTLTEIRYKISLSPWWVTKVYKEMRSSGLPQG